MEIVVALAKIYRAERLVGVNSVQVAGVSYKNLGQAGLEFLQEWAALGAKVCVPTTLNPAGIDLIRWKALGFSHEFAVQQQSVIDAYTAMGITPTCTCTPYFVGNQPQFGDHIAWAESSAVSFANSILGARTNREGGPSALAAAICGRTAGYGLHLDSRRQAQYLIEVRCRLRTISDWGALGYLVGRQIRNSVPCFLLSEGPFTQPVADPLVVPALLDRLKSLGAALAASGAVALYHIDGITPETKQRDVVAPNVRHITVDSLDKGYAALDGEPERVDLVSIGCPHASDNEIGAVAKAIQGRTLKAALWITTARETRERMAAHVSTIERAGAQVISDTCMVVAPVEQLGFQVMATNSAKMATYTPSHSGLSVRFGSLEQCLEAAVTGTWTK
jgi:predicted aconitase